MDVQFHLFHALNYVCLAAMTCGRGSVYNSCVKVCEQPACGKEVADTCGEDDMFDCEEACQCLTGYVLENGACVKSDTCGCHYNGRIIPVSVNL